MSIKKIHKYFEIPSRKAYVCKKYLIFIDFYTKFLF